ncbi:MAG TPA: GntR family transcriptional regulator [Promineifilum sp.]
MLRRAPSLTDQVKSHIKDLIVRGEFPDGRIPPETELAGELGVSRTTVRDALSRLEIEGAISRKQGAGTFVNDPVLQIHSRLEEIWSYEAMLRAHGFTPSIRVLESDVRPASSEIRGDLGLAPGEQVLFISKLFLEDDVPVILAENHIPVRLLTEPYLPEDLARPVYDVLESFGRQRLAYYLSEIIPKTADSTLADVLQIRPDSPLISFSEIGYNDENEPILKASSFFRDDLLRLRLLRRRV